MANTPYGSSFEEQHDPDRAQEYTILRLISRVHTAQLVRVMAVEPVADRVGFVTCQPVIQDTATNGVLIAQSPIYRVPYLRVQGGVSALIIDPAEGDIGVGGWGTARVHNRGVPLSFGYGCGWAAHAAGVTGFEAKNDAQVDYGTMLAVAVPPPADTGDTGDTGASDTGADTGDTADTATGDTQIDASGSLDPGTRVESACGACRAALLAGEPLDACVELDHAFGWPFVEPF